jgi:hypothetical protein
MSKFPSCSLGVVDANHNIWGSISEQSCAFLPGVSSEPA